MDQRFYGFGFGRLIGCWLKKHLSSWLTPPGRRSCWWPPCPGRRRSRAAGPPCHPSSGEPGDAGDQSDVSITMSSANKRQVFTNYLDHHHGAQHALLLPRDPAPGQEKYVHQEQNIGKYDQNINNIIASEVQINPFVVNERRSRRSVSNN